MNFLRSALVTSRSRLVSVAASNTLEKSEEHSAHPVRSSRGLVADEQS